MFPQSARNRPGRAGLTKDSLDRSPFRTADTSIAFLVHGIEVSIGDIDISFVEVFDVGILLHRLIYFIIASGHRRDFIIYAVCNSKERSVYFKKSLLDLV